MHYYRWFSSSSTIVWAIVPAHRMQESLSLPTFKRKQLRHESPPPLGTSFLPLSRTDTLSVVSIQSQDTFIQHCVQPNSTPSTPAVPLPFRSSSLFVCYSLPWHCPLISYPATNVGADNHTQKKTYKHKQYPCLSDVLQWYLCAILLSSIFTHLCFCFCLFVSDKLNW